MKARKIISAAALSLPLAACATARPAVARHSAAPVSSSPVSPAAVVRPAGCRQAARLLTMTEKDLKIAPGNPDTPAVTAMMLRAAARVTVPAGPVRRELLAIARDVQGEALGSLSTDLGKLKATCGF